MGLLVEINTTLGHDAHFVFFSKRKLGGVEEMRDPGTLLMINNFIATLSDDLCVSVITYFYL